MAARLFPQTGLPWRCRSSFCRLSGDCTSQRVLTGDEVDRTGIEPATRTLQMSAAPLGHAYPEKLEPSGIAPDTEEACTSPYPQRKLTSIASDLSHHSSRSHKHSLQRRDSNSHHRSKQLRALPLDHTGMLRIR